MISKTFIAAVALSLPLFSVRADYKIESAELAISVSSSNAAFSVTDKRTGRVWESEPEYLNMPVDMKVVSGSASGREIKISMTARGRRSLSAVFRLENEPGEFTVTFDTTWKYKKPWELAFPGPLRTKKGDRIIVPLNEGMGFPVDGENEKFKSLSGFSGHGLSMAFYGVAEDASGAGWMSIVEESPEDMRMQVCRLGPEKLFAVCPRWMSEGCEIVYPRRLRYVFLPKGGHVAMCKRYRKYAKAKGYLKTFKEKAKTRPNVLKLPGSVNIWYFQKDQAAMAKEVRDAGIERILWSGGNRTDASNITEIAKIPGVLIGRYDLYQGVNPPELTARLNGRTGYNPEAWPDDILWDGPTSNDWHRGWEVRMKDGTKYNYAVLCPSKAPDYARRKILEELKTHPYNTRFLDTTCSTPWLECKNPAHPLTRRECRRKRIELLGVLSDELGLVTGTENGHETAVPVCDYFEGMMSISPYTLPDCGRNMPVIWTNDLPRLTAEYSMNPQLRLPLWELVFHDCICNEYYWGDYNNKMPALWYRKDLFNLLYGTMPMLMFDRELWKKHKSRFVKSYRVCEQVARSAGFSEMLDHRFLTKDRLVQETEFADGTVVTVNFSHRPFLCADGYEIAKNEYRVRQPPHKEGYFLRDASCEIDFVPLAQKTEFSLDEEVERRGSVSLRKVCMKHSGKGDRAMTLAYDIPLPEGPITVFNAPDNSRTVNYWDAPVTVDGRPCAAGAGKLPRWPFIAVKTAKGTRAVGLAPGSIAVFRLTVDPVRRVMRIFFDLGFTEEKKDATFSFADFTFDPFADHGYRGAWKTWMEAFPEYYTVRDKKHGTWMVHYPISKVKDWQDFGFRYKEGYKEAAWDNTNGVLPLHYSSSGAWSMRYLDTKIKDVTKATYQDAEKEALSQAARGVLKAKAWFASRMLDENGVPAGVQLNTGWGKGWTWSMNSAPGIKGEITDFSTKASDKVFGGFYDDAPGKTPLAGEYYDSSYMGKTVELDYDRNHFSAMRTPLSFAKGTFRPVIYKGMIGFEYLKSIADRLHARGKIVMANEAPKNWCWVAPLCDVLGQEAGWNRKGKWRPFSRDEMILRRMQCGAKPYCIIQNDDYVAFAPYVKRYMERCLAYGFMPGFFSPKSAADDSHYFAHPEFYERDRPLFKKYVPLCRLLSEAGWRPLNALLPAAANKDISAEQFGDRYVALFNHSTKSATVKLPREIRELVTDSLVKGSLTLEPETCRVLDLYR